MFFVNFFHWLGWMDNSQEKKLLTLLLMMENVVQ